MVVIYSVGYVPQGKACTCARTVYETTYDNIDSDQTCGLTLPSSTPLVVIVVVPLASHYASLQNLVGQVDVHQK